MAMMNVCYSIAIDLGETIEITGFTYLPRLDSSIGGVIDTYEFHVSDDGIDWGESAAKGRFDNIENNPIQQVVKLKKAVSGRFVRLTSISGVKNQLFAGAAEIGVMGQLAASGKKRFPDKNMSAKPFSVVVIPDTQMWAQDRPDWFTASTKWIAANRAKENIKFVIQVGDIVNSYEEPYQWVNANTAMSILDGKVPYCFAVGNHDMLKGEPQWVPDASRDTTFYNDTFPYTRYENEPWYGGRMLNDTFVPSDNYDNTYHFFSAGSMEFMILSLSVAPTDDILAWADGIIAAHPDKRVIFLTHSYMSGNSRVTSDPYSPPGGNAGEQVWQKFVKKHPNIFLVACGHLANGRLTSTGDSGNMVHQFVNNSDWIRILKFVPEENVIHVTSYKPWLDQYSTDDADQWDWQYDMN